MIHAVRPGATILVANDHEWTARSLETILTAEGHTVVRAFTAAQALERASQTRPDACIFDVQLPDQDGMTLCQLIRNMPFLGPAVPVFLTTAGPSGRHERLAAYRAGAWEFFGQPLDGEALLLKLNVYLGAKAVVDGLRSESLIDGPTGLYSRVGLVRRGSELAADAARRRQALACVVLRPILPELQAAVDAAEQVGREVAALLRTSGRSADAIGRVGGLDFGVIASGTDREAADHLVRRLNEAAAGSLLGGSITGDAAFRAAVCVADNPANEPVDAGEMLLRAEAAIQRTENETLINSD
jgi:PleD family two-component response regulator